MQDDTLVPFGADLARTTTRSNALNLDTIQLWTEGNDREDADDLADQAD